MNSFPIVVAWHDWKANKNKWEIAENTSELIEIVERARLKCDSAFGVMLFKMDDVLNRNEEIPWEKII